MLINDDNPQRMPDCQGLYGNGATLSIHSPLTKAGWAGMGSQTDPALYWLAHAFMTACCSDKSS